MLQIYLANFCSYKDIQFSKYFILNIANDEKRDNGKKLILEEKKDEARFGRCDKLFILRVKLCWKKS